METIIIWAVIAWVVMRWIEARATERLEFRRRLQEVREQHQPVRLTVEDMNGMIYCWDTATMDFVCQGRDLEEIRKNFALRFPDRNAAIAQGPEELVAKLKQELQALKQNENFSSQ